MRTTNRITILAVCLALALVFAVGCGPADTKDALIGTWKAVKVTREGKEEKVPDLAFRIDPDGKLGGEENGKEATGFWQVVSQDGEDFLLFGKKQGRFDHAYLVGFSEDQDQLILTRRDEEPPYKPWRPERVIYLQRQ